jgi:hypothetical protein
MQQLLNQPVVREPFVERRFAECDAHGIAERMSGRELDGVGEWFMADGFAYERDGRTIGDGLVDAKHIELFAVVKRNRRQQHIQRNAVGRRGSDLQQLFNQPVVREPFIGRRFAERDAHRIAWRLPGRQLDSIR